VAAVTRSFRNGPPGPARRARRLLAGPTFLAGVAAAQARSSAPYPRPGADVAAVRRYFVDNAGAARLSVAGQLVSAGCLAAFTTTVAAQAGEVDPRLRAVAATAGGTAAAALVASAAGSGALTGPAGRDPVAAARLHHRVFVAGGPVHTAAFGALLATLGVAGRRRGLPPALTTAALGAGAAGLLSPLALVSAPAAWFIPAGRFPGLVIAAVTGGLALRRRTPTDPTRPEVTDGLRDHRSQRLLDGFIAGPDDGAEFPLGRGGDALFAWGSAGPEGNAMGPWLRPRTPAWSWCGSG
jgi:hypothetical protein